MSQRDGHFRGVQQLLLFVCLEVIKRTQLSSFRILVVGPTDIGDRIDEGKCIAVVATAYPVGKYGP